MYYYRWKGAALVSPAPLEGFGPETDPAADGPIFALVPGDPVLGRGSFRVNHPGQLLAGHGLEPAAYREKWGLKKDTPLVSKGLQRERRKKMKDMKLWEKRRKPVAQEA